MGELAARLNARKRTSPPRRSAPAQLAGLVARIADGTLSGKIAKEVFDALWGGEGQDADAIIEARA
jgi:aspartyl-tRNA(Asn)/glutamyl-tRNA(Gln) amidotransferase subunit B